ncbi:MAG: 16S rRNA (cytosine(1402)-N(4))-methyltransferase RsmH [Ottowia sp.]|nr:16S rRNA (cytosine(1402)-N(4))-methyltransferase RsmH [Ottowia sp.]
MNVEQQIGRHDTVLLQEAVDALVKQVDGVYVDGTFGRGGHSLAILARLSAAGRLLAFDKDIQAGECAQQIQDSRFTWVHGSFTELASMLAVHKMDGLSGVLFDLGVSSPQIDESQRGFSFRQDGPLDMRMDTTRGLTAAQWLAQVDEDELTRVIRDYGEERFARPIAKAIVARRMQVALGPLERTAELAALVAQVVKTREPGQDPATRTFQAIRIFINQELEDLSRGLEMALEALAPGGRLVVISFHSLEDRIVKRFMYAKASRQASVHDSVSRRLPLRESELPAARLKLLGRVRAGTAELAVNRRARSAVMRIAEKLS